MSHSAVTTPSPYVVGHVIKTTSSEDEDMTATVTKVFPITTSPVMEVQMRTKKGFQKYILKIFDRRFGIQRRPCGRKSQYPHTQQVENAWQTYIRKGLAKPLCDELIRQDEEEGLGLYEAPDSDTPKPEWETLGEEEGIIYHKAQRCFRNEVQAYEQLRNLQGRCIPRLIASVTIDPSSSSLCGPPELPPVYFRISGILLQKINGFVLTELVSKIPLELVLWEEVIQNAVDAAKEVNRCGVISFDSDPRNVVVAEVTHQPFLIDSARSACKEAYEDNDDMDNENGFCFNVSIHDNPGAIGVVMANAVEKATGFKPRIQYR